MQERLGGRAASKVGAFGAIHGHFRVSRGLWRRNRLRNEQAFQARRQWNTCLYSLSLNTYNVSMINNPLLKKPRIARG